jgi:hypothetical protein
MEIKLTQQDKLEILAKQNVVSVGIGYKKVNNLQTDTLCIIVGVTEKKPLDTLLDEDIVPDIYSNFITDVIETGSEFKSLAPNCMDIDDPDLPSGCSTHTTGLDSAVKGGMQIGPDSNSPNYGSVGTLGAICRDQTDGKLVGLTNSHVLGQVLRTSNFIDNSNSHLSEFMSANEVTDIQISQTPGAGQPTFGRYKRTVEIDAYDLNTFPVVPNTTAGNVRVQTVDAGIIDIDPTSTGNRVVSPIIHSCAAATPLLNSCPVYNFTSTTSDILGKRFIKIGRTTGSTPLEDNYYDIYGVIDTVDVSLYLNHISDPPNSSDQIKSVFDDCIKIKMIDNGVDVPAATARPSQPGDSGSCVFIWNNDRWEVLGLLFAGTEPLNPQTTPAYAIICRIDHVMKALSLGDNWNFTSSTSHLSAVQPQPQTLSESGIDFYPDISDPGLTGSRYIWDGSISCNSTEEYIKMIDGDGQPIVYKRRDNSFNDVTTFTHYISSSHIESIPGSDIRDIEMYVDSSKYYIDSAISRDIYVSKLEPGTVYRFILPTSTYNSHPLKVGTIIDDNNSWINTSVSNSGNNTIISLNIDDIGSYKKIYYFCEQHTDMGGVIYVLHNPYNGNSTY